MASQLDSPPAHPPSDFADVSIASVTGLAFAVIILYLFAVPIAGKLAANRDFLSYWATGRQLIHHHNPYDRDAIYAIEHDAGLGTGLDPRTVLIMRNPPWALPIAYPLGLLNLRLAGILWSLLLLACLLVSIHILHQLYGSPPTRIHWLGLAFTPAIICLTMGQTAILALLGFVLFLRFHRCHPFLAGAALWLCALKPHLFLPFIAALVLWIILTRAWPLVAGFATALAFTSILATIIDSASWSDYTHLMRSPSVENQFIPCLAGALRHWFRPHAVWMQYLPVALACLWAVAYFWRRRAHWDWLSNSSILILVSLLAAPYSWLYDQCLAVPALLDGAYATGSRKLLAALPLIILATDLELLFVKVTSTLFLWTIPAWLIWFLLARATSAKESAPL